MSFNSNTELVRYLVDSGVLKTPRIIDAFHTVDRKDFVQPSEVNLAYENHPLPIGKGQTISQPYTVAFMLEELQPKQGEVVLDVGSGSGWATALLAKIVGPEGYVYGTEIVPSLVEFGRQNLSRYNFVNTEIMQVDKGQIGIPGKKFEKILVSAAAEKLPDELCNQLGEGGVMVIPVGSSILRVSKTINSCTIEKEHYGFSFVPLID